MPPHNRTCAGCSATFHSAAKAVWCPDCLPTVKPFPVELSVDQRERLKALAIVRDVTPEEVMRQALTALGARSKGKRLTPPDQSEAERLRPGAR